MITLDPLGRPTFDSLLHTSRGTLFPDCFYSTFHDFISSVNDISASSPFTNIVDTSSKISGQTSLQMKFDEDKTTVSEMDGADVTCLPADSDRRIMRTWTDFDILEPHFSQEQENMEATAIKVDYAASYSAFKPIQVISSDTNS